MCSCTNQETGARLLLSSGETTETGLWPFELVADPENRDALLEVMRELPTNVTEAAEACIQESQVRGSESEQAAGNFRVAAKGGDGEWLSLTSIPAIDEATRH